MHRRDGFSLIELLIVVAIILIIAAIAIPSLLRARISANESTLVADARTVLAAEQAYAAAASAAADLPCLVNPSTCYTGLGTAPMIDPALGAANVGVVKNGYRRAFVGDGAVPPGPGRLVTHHGSYSYEGVPVRVAFTGQRAFCMDSGGAACFDPTGVAVCGGAPQIPACAPGQALGQ